MRYVLQLEPVTFLSYEKEGQEEYNNFDPFLYSKLVDGREVMLRIPQNRKIDLKVRAGLILGLAHDMQIWIKRGGLFACDGVFEKYQKESAERFVKEKLEESKIYRTQRYAYSKKMFPKLYCLELLHEEWDYHLRETDYVLYGHGSCGYEKLHVEYDKWLKNEHMLDLEDVIMIVYRYSREVEHSDQNLEIMEKMMEEELLPWFKKRNE